MIKPERLQEIQRMIDTELITNIIDMLKRKAMPAKLSSVSGTDVIEKYTDFNLLVDAINTEKIIKTTVRLSHSTLFDEDACPGLEKAGNFADKNLSMANRVKLRILRAIFQVCKMVSELRVIPAVQGKIVIAEFGDDYGSIYYHD